jgi:hypothetical protein
MIVGDIKFEEAVEALSPAEQILRREINPHVHGAREFRNKVAHHEPFLARVLEGPKITLSGDLHDLGKTGRHRKAQAA